MHEEKMRPPKKKILHAHMKKAGEKSHNRTSRQKASNSAVLRRTTLVQPGKSKLHGCTI
jgi:hypothetical protein